MELIGAQLGLNQKLTSPGDIGQLAKLSSDAETAIQAVASYLHLDWQNAATIRMEIFGERCHLQFTIESRSNARHLVDAGLVVIFPLLKILTGSTFTLEQVLLSHSLSSDLRY